MIHTIAPLTAAPSTQFSPQQVAKTADGTLRYQFGQQRLSQAGRRPAQAQTQLWLGLRGAGFALNSQEYAAGESAWLPAGEAFELQLAKAHMDVLVLSINPLLLSAKVRQLSFSGALSLPLAATQETLCYVQSGQLTAGGHTLAPGALLQITNESALALHSAKKVALVLFTLSPLAMPLPTPEA
ncbi:MAG: hypothetical protein ACRCYV_03065 [Aeromonas sp.]